ncbi:DUF1302 domain-containing protein [Aquabacterium sp.]|uniref:DUF1302 domain-containing protein n=1 Tax=Aquabacterium sp. TaxID=1872578 RepID=UPI003BB104B5
MMKRNRRLPSQIRLLAIAAATCASASHVSAFDIDTGNPDLSVRWDNTFKYSTAWRVKAPSAELTGPASANHDDGNLNFGKGRISNRVDWLTEADVVYARNYGFRLSAAAWYDSVYNGRNDNPGFAGGAFPNNWSIPSNAFSDETRRLHGRKADLLDAFVFGGFDVGDTRLNLRLGRHSVLWGETLFFGMNGIAGAMAPVDVIKLASVPGTQFKEAIRPTPQISAQWQLSSNVSVGAFYQFNWEENRLPAAGSYFSGLDFQPAGGVALNTGPGVQAMRRADQKPSDLGQGGVQLRFTALETDFGLYAVRFHSKTPQQVNNIGVLGLDSYQLAYQQGITALGASASHAFGPMQVSAEASIRRNQDLASSAAVDLGPIFGLPITTNNTNNPGYAVGRTAHINLSTMWTLPSTPLAREAMLMGEIMWNRVLSVDKNPGALDPNSTRDAISLRLLFEPTYRQVLPGLDIGVPIGVGYSPKGSRSRTLGPALPPDNGGDFTIGLNGSYLDEWRFSVNYTSYFGSAKPILAGNPPSFSYGQFMRDRNFVSLSVRRTF